MEFLLFYLSCFKIFIIELFELFDFGVRFVLLGFINEIVFYKFLLFLLLGMIFYL